MPILGTIASSTQQGLVSSSYFSIASQAITSNTQEVVFDNIPQTYAHLQIRVLSITNSAYNGAQIKFNDSSTSYGILFAYSSGSGTPSVSDTQDTAYSYFPNFNGVGATTGPGPSIADFYDYTNTNKWKQFRYLEGAWATDNTGYICIGSGVWRNTSAITKISMSMVGFRWTNGAHLALYGIKAA